MNRFINKSIHHSLSSEDPNTVMNIVYDSNEVNSLCITEVPEKNALEFVRQHALLCDIVCCVRRKNIAGRLAYKYNFGADSECGK